MTQETLNKRVAPIQYRIFAFLLDITLVMTFLFMILYSWIIPSYHASGAEELKQMSDNHFEGTPLPPVYEWSDEVKELVVTTELTLVLGVWLYFWMSDWWGRGSTLGKRTFSLQVVKERDLRSLTTLDALLRSGFKTFSLLAFFPILTLSYTLAFFNKKRQTGHDLLTRTLVITYDPSKQNDTPS